MPTVSSTMTTALQALAAANHAAPVGGASGSWRWTLRQRVGEVREALVAESTGSGDGDWLAARGGDRFAERNDLLLRLGELVDKVLEDPDAATVQTLVARIVADVRRHLQPLPG